MLSTDVYYQRTPKLGMSLITVAKYNVTNALQNLYALKSLVLRPFQLKQNNIQTAVTNMTKQRMLQKTLINDLTLIVCLNIRPQ